MNRKIEAVRQALSAERKAVLLHSNADMDCVGSAAALALHYGNCILMAPAGISHLGKGLLSFLGIEASTELDTGAADVFFAVDAHDGASLGYSGVPWEMTFVIDHHEACIEAIPIRGIVDPEATSCCELIWEIIGKPDVIGEQIGYCLMAGILADTGHLRRGSHATLRTASEILEASGLDIEDILVLFESAEDQDMSRRISRLKGVQRMRHDRVGDWLVAVTEIGAFESAVCHGVLSLGADVAFAGSQNEDTYRLTGRANRAALNAGLNLGRMFDDIARECNGEGGGHDGAAGLSGTGDTEAMLGICMNRTLAFLKGRKRCCNSREENVL